MIGGIVERVLESIRNPLYRNSLYISLSMMITAGAGFIFWNVSARLYSASDVGAASALISAINLVFTVSMLGLNFSMIRFYPVYRERVMESTLAITVLAAFIISFVYTFFVKITGSFGGMFSIRFMVIFVFFSVVSTVYNVFFTYAIARRKAEYGFVQSVLFALRFLFLFVFVPLGALGIVSSFGLGLLSGVVYGVMVAGSVWPRFDMRFLRESFSFSLGNYLADLANTTPNYIMPTVVLAILGSDDAAYFYIAFSVGLLLLFVPNAINMSFFVEGSHGLESMKRTLQKAMLLSYVYLVLVTVFVWFFGSAILRLFGEEYVAGLRLLRIMMVGSFFVVPVNFAITILNIRRKVKDVVFLNVLKAVIFISISYILMPSMGINAVGFGWVGSYVVVLAVILTMGILRTV